MLSTIRYRLAQLACSLLLHSGLCRLWVRFHARRGRITSFYLHNPSRPLFGALLEHAHRLGFDCISAEQLNQRIHARSSAARPLLFLSIDDGWRSVLANIAPAAERQRAPVAYFIATGSVDCGDFWWRRVAPGQVRRLKRLPNAARMQALRACPPPQQRVALSWDELRQLNAMPHATIGSHTHNHPILTSCTGPEAAHEIAAGHAALHAGLGSAPTCFAYPNGDFRHADAAILARLGYQLAFTVDAGFIQPERVANRYQLPRFAGNEKGSVEENVCRMIGLWPYRSWLRRR